MQWLLQLLPQQKIKGDENLQVGRIDGQLIYTQRTDNSQTIYNHTVYVLNAEPTEQAPPAEPAERPALTVAVAPLRTENTKLIESEQLALLRLMRSSNRLEGLGRAFMRREFGDAYVKGLSRAQVYRTMRYLQACSSKENKAYGETA